jgi:hypothetical protein
VACAQHGSRKMKTNHRNINHPPTIIYDDGYY